MAGQFSLGDLIPAGERLTIVDIGAMEIGSQAADYASLLELDNVRVIGFEPDAAECAKLNSTAGDKKVYHPYFLGAGGAATYFETNQAMTGSLFAPHDELLGKFQNLLELTTLVDTHGVDTHRLDDIEGLGDVDLIKIDVQGSELDVFKAGVKTLEMATVVQTEAEFVSLYKDQPLFADVDTFLRSRDYQFHNFLNFGSRCFKPFVMDGNPNRGINQKLWTDVVYVKDFMNLEKLTVNKLLKMAVILNDVYQSFDLCYVILANVDERHGSDHKSDFLQRVTQAGGG